jgi:hypothetical protein
MDSLNLAPFDALQRITADSKTVKATRAGDVSNHLADRTLMKAVLFVCFI